MDQKYKQLYKDVQGLRYKLHDLLDDQAHPVSQQLKNTVQRLEDEMEMSKHPRTLEDRIVSIQHHLKQVKSDNQLNIMNIEHAAMLEHRFEDMRMSLRRLPNY